MTRVRMALLAIACFVVSGMTHLEAAIAYVSSAAGHPLLSGNSIDSTTTVEADTAGASFLIVSCSYYNGTTPTITVTDSYSNTWVGLLPWTSTGGGTTAQLFIVNSNTPTVGVSHTATCFGSQTYSVAVLAAFSGTDASPYDSENGNVDGFPNPPPVTGTVTGGITPVVVGELFVMALATGEPTNNDISPTAPFTLIYENGFGGGDTMGGGMAYYINPDLTGVNGEWTWTPGITNIAAVIVAIKPLGVGGAGSNLLLLGVE